MASVEDVESMSDDDLVTQFRGLVAATAMRGKSTVDLTVNRMDRELKERLKAGKTAQETLTQYQERS